MTPSAKGNPNQRLRRERLLRGWSQKDVAEKIGTDSKIVGKWERGDIAPGPFSRQKLCELFGKNTEELGFLSDAPEQSKDQSLAGRSLDMHGAAFTSETLLSGAPISSVLFWNVPYRRNPFFTGREDIFVRLHDSLTSHKVAAVTHSHAISGLGGIGKTQTAVEYAYRYCSDYQAILWTRADSRDLLVSDFVSIAALLKLPEKDEQDQSRAVNAFKQWLHEHDSWLLILDNADELATIRDLLPQTGSGNILLTTRQPVNGEIAQSVELEKMTAEEGMRFLLRRARIMAADTSLDDVSHMNRVAAQQIVQAMDGLPLALDQAGAYIETTACGMVGYWERYKQQRTRLLRLRGQVAVYDHPAPVATTWSLSFEKAQQANPAAAELLQFCAFLHPDAIPEEILTKGAPELGPLLAPIAADLIDLDTAIGELRKYSLLRRDPDIQILNIHRLIQAVLKDAMDENTQRQWAERTVRAVNRTFPDVEFATWHLCQRCLPHAQVCAELISQWNLAFPEAARLLYQAGCYVGERAQHSQAERFFLQSLALYKNVMGPEHSNVAKNLDILGITSYHQGKYVQAESFFLLALDLRDKLLDEAELAESINNLAMLYLDQGKYFQAEPLARRALEIWKRTLKPEHPLVASGYSNLGLVYYIQEKYALAEPLYQQALTIRTQTLEPEHPDVIVSLNNLGALYRNQGKYAEAEPLLKRALVIREQILEPGHPDVATSMSNLGQLYYAQGKYAEAEPLLKQALVIREQTLGSEHPDVAMSLHKLALLYKTQGEYAQAEPLLRRALTIRKQTLEPGHSDVDDSLGHYTDLLRKTNRSNEAEALEAHMQMLRAVQSQQNT